MWLSRDGNDLHGVRSRSAFTAVNRHMGSRRRLPRNSASGTSSVLGVGVYRGKPQPRHNRRSSSNARSDWFVTLRLTTIHDTKLGANAIVIPWGLAMVIANQLRSRGRNQRWFTAVNRRPGSTGDTIGTDPLRSTRRPCWFTAVNQGAGTNRCTDTRPKRASWSRRRICR